MNLDTWQQLGSRREIHGMDVFYRHDGSGPPLLLLHAFPTASWGWHKVWATLAAHFTVIAPDLPGSGLSAKPDTVYSVIWLTDVVEDLLAELGIRDAHVLGHAYGTSVVQELLARQRDGTASITIRSAVFLDGGIFPEAVRTTRMQRFLLTAPGRFFARRFPVRYPLFRRSLARMFGTGYRPSPAEMRDCWRLLSHNRGHHVVIRVMQYLGERWQRRDRWVGALAETTVPIGLIHNTGDPLGGDAVAQRWRELLPHAPVLELPAEAGHYPPLEAPDAVTAAYLGFIRGGTEAADEPAPGH